MVRSVRVGSLRAPTHARRWRAPDATRARKGVRVRPLRITDSCDLLLAPPKIVSMSEDQFTRAVGILADMLADRNAGGELQPIRSVGLYREFAQRSTTVSTNCLVSASDGPAVAPGA